MPQYNNPDRVCFSFMIYGIINFGEAFLYTEQKSLNYIRKTLISVVTYLVLIILSWIFDLASIIWLFNISGRWGLKFTTQRQTYELFHRPLGRAVFRSLCSAERYACSYWLRKHCLMKSSSWRLTVLVNT